MRRVLPLVLTLAFAAGLAGPAPAATRTVKVGDTFFGRPAGTPTITVEKGTRMRFRWVGQALHNVHATRGPATFRSRIKSSGTYKRRMRKRGTYKLRCDIHPTIMRARLVVE